MFRLERRAGRNFVSALGLSLLAFSVATPQPVDAAVIAGPTLDQAPAGEGYPYVAIAFRALRNTTLVSFVFQNRGNADTIVLVADPFPGLSIQTPANTPSYKATVNWQLTAGQTYWLVDEYASKYYSNARYAAWDQPLPSNSDIALVASSLFGYDLPEVLNNTWGFGPNSYWVAFNAITTSPLTGFSGSAPEASTWAALLLGFAALAGLRARRFRVGRGRAAVSRHEPAG